MIYSREEIDLELTHIFLLLQQIVKNENILFEKQFIQLENLLFKIKQINNLQNILLKFILNHLITAELNSAGSFVEILKNFKHKIDLKLIQPKMPSIYDIDWLLSYFKFDDELSEIISEILILSGFNGKILIDKNNNKTLIEKRFGYTFTNLKFDTKYCSKLINPRLILIDGYIENISEIHVLLEQSFDAKEYLCIVCRGMSDDVINTLNVNWNRGTLRVVPIFVQYDLDGINTLNDIASIAMSDVVSSLKGQVISAIKYNDLAYVDFIELTSNKVIFVNKNCKLNVQNHINELLKKRQISHEDLHTLYDARIKALSSNLLILKLRDDIKFLEKKQKIDKFLRAFKQLLQFGTVEVQNTKLLTTTAIQIYKFSKSLQENLENLGCVINNSEN